MASLWADVDDIWGIRGHEPETAHVELEEDIVFVALFTVPIAPPPEPCVHAKRHHSSHTLSERMPVK